MTGTPHTPPAKRLRSSPQTSPSAAAKMSPDQLLSMFRAAATMHGFNLGDILPDSSVTSISAEDINSEVESDNGYFFCSKEVAPADISLRSKPAV